MAVKKSTTSKGSTKTATKAKAAPKKAAPKAKADTRTKSPKAGGAKKAAVAVAASLLTIIYHLLKSGSSYQDLGANYFDRHDQARTAKRLLKRLSDLGFHLQVAAPA